MKNRNDTRKITAFGKKYVNKEKKKSNNSLVFKDDLESEIFIFVKFHFVVFIHVYFKKEDKNSAT